MTDPLEENTRQSSTYVLSMLRQTTRAVRVDLERLHDGWMRLRFPGDLSDDHSVIEHWQPSTTRGIMAFRLWAILGALLVVLVYPLFVVGLATRFYSRRIDRVSASLGFIGVAAVSLLVWGAFTALTYIAPIAFEGFVAVAIAGVVATISSVLALYFTRVDGRAVTVALGYPFGMTALFLPPVVAALYSRILASIIFPRSETIAIWLLDNLLQYGGIAAFIRATFELDGAGHVGMWFGLAFPSGWILGTLVTLTYVIQRADERNPLDDPKSEFILK